MTSKEQLLYLLENYYNNNYDTRTFVDEYHRIYNFELNDLNLLLKEKQLFYELSVVVARFSPFEEDLKIPNAYFSERDVKEKATNVYLQLNEKIR